MSIPSIRSAEIGEEAHVIALMTLSFAAEPFVRWLFPDPDTYLAAMPKATSAFGVNAFAAGTVDVVGDGAGAAIWLPPGVEADSECLEATFADYVAEEKASTLASVADQMEHAHPPEPHWYLPMIGIDPVAQSRGLGTALMRHALSRSDAAGVSAYLELSNRRNMSFYERLGFETIRVIRVGSCPEVMAMVRRPRRV
ncbi:GNAT family N-acetyltransferase [Ectothiorhodospiraceae bacterium 2226]|nr:GNAT family N-acetyltransferase [Ectothiorhodospiraceae bacterium 2226]